MRTIANCSPREFLAQTNRIRRSAARWLEMSGAAAILRSEGELRGKVDGLLRGVLEKCPEETMELLGLMCFIEPEELDRHSVAELLGAAREIAGCPEVVDFFISLARLEIRLTSGDANP